MYRNSLDRPIRAENDPGPHKPNPVTVAKKHEQSDVFEQPKRPKSSVLGANKTHFGQL